MDNPEEIKDEVVFITKLRKARDLKIYKKLELTQPVMMKLIDKLCAYYSNSSLKHP